MDCHRLREPKAPPLESGPAAGLALFFCVGTGSVRFSEAMKAESSRAGDSVPVREEEDHIAPRPRRPPGALAAFSVSGDLRE